MGDRIIIKRCRAVKATRNAASSMPVSSTPRREGIVRSHLADDLPIGSFMLRLSLWLLAHRASPVLRAVIAHLHQARSALSLRRLAHAAQRWA